MKDRLVRSYSANELLDVVHRLRTDAVQSNRLLERGGTPHQRKWIDWLNANSPRRDARDLYQRLQRGDQIVWLSEAAGELPQRIRIAIIAMQGARSEQSKAKIARKYLPWECVASLLFEKRAMPAVRRKPG